MPTPTPHQRRYCHRLQVEFGQIYVSRPVFIEADGETVALLPKDARLRNLTYAAPLYIDVLKRERVGRRPGGEDGEDGGGGGEEGEEEVVDVVTYDKTFLGEVRRRSYAVGGCSEGWALGGACRRATLAACVCEGRGAPFLSPQRGGLRGGRAAPVPSLFLLHCNPTPPPPSPPLGRPPRTPHRCPSCCALTTATSTAGATATFATSANAPTTRAATL